MLLLKWINKVTFLKDGRLRDRHQLSVFERCAANRGVKYRKMTEKDVQRPKPVVRLTEVFVKKEFLYSILSVRSSTLKKMRDLSARGSVAR